MICKKWHAYVPSHWCQLVLAVALAGWTCLPANATTRVFLLAGQSNMVGIGESSELTPPLSNPQNDVLFWDNGWVALQSGFGNDFGPELSFGRALADALTSDDIYLVKYARGGSGLADPTDWDPAAGSDYSTFRSRVNAALANLDTANIDYEISGMLWMQGEHDTLDSDDAAAYEDNLTDFIATVRDEFATPDMPFIIGRILTHFGTTENNALVRDAQVAVAANDDDVYWVDTDSLQLGAAGHYGTEGQIELGELFAETNLTAIPEPQSCSLFLLGAAGLIVMRRRHWPRQSQWDGLP